MSLNNKNNNAVNRIDLKLYSINQLFNSMDPSPFHEKDLDDDAAAFIVSWAMEFPKPNPFLLTVHVSTVPGGADPKAIVEEAVHNFFGREAELIRRQFRQLMAQGRFSLITGLIFLTICLVSSELIRGLGTGALIELASESLIICGWVAMWRPMQIFLYEWRPLYHKRKVYQRLSQMQVEVLVGV